MKKILITAALSLLAGSAMAANVGVSVSVGQPGFYGHIEIGNMPQPQIIYPAPVIIQPVPVGVVVQPVYLRVPPGHEKHWAKHCRKYNACGQPVYFVQQNWYQNVYAPGYRLEHGEQDGNQGDNGHGKSRKKKKHNDD
ncbi:MAG: hypothetical protein RIS34_1977 [Pseudomonadota bacterium]|jgi:hypothetical protein